MKPQQFILLPPRGISPADTGPTVSSVEPFFLSLESSRFAGNALRSLTASKIKTKLKVLDSIHENGAKLIELDAASVSSLQAEQPGIRIVPVVYYYPARAPIPQPTATPKAAAAALKITLRVISKQDGRAIRGVKVIAFTDFAQRIGAQGVTNAAGSVSLSLGAATKKVERLYAYASSGYWSALRQNVKLTSGQEIPLTPIDVGFTDCLRHFYGRAPDAAGQGVTVGVIDTGVGPHRDLTLAGGENTVVGENPSEFMDNGEGHGTHVAGIIAAHGVAATGIRGLAPAVTLQSYRVFGKDAEGASNFAIAKALDRAVAHGCDLINMSLGGGPRDEATHSAIADARGKGSVVIVATGNDDRAPVSFPASDSLAIAVSAMGRKKTFPDGATEAGDVASPFGTDKANFIAAFSNVGPEVLLTAPGVGIISTFPSDRYAVMDGTSMACPAVTGAAARLLAAEPALLTSTRDQKRSNAIVQIILDAAHKLGFPATMEGRGLIRL